MVFSPDRVCLLLFSEKPSPDLPFLAFLEFLAFFFRKGFPSLEGILGVHPGRQILVFFSCFPCLLPKKTARERRLGRRRRTTICGSPIPNGFSWVETLLCIFCSSTSLEEREPSTSSSGSSRGVRWQPYDHDYPKNLFGLFITFGLFPFGKVIFGDPPERPLENKHNIDISKASFTSQGYFCLAR